MGMAMIDLIFEGLAKKNPTSGSLYFSLSFSLHLTRMGENKGKREIKYWEPDVGFFLFQFLDSSFFIFSASFLISSLLCSAV